MDYLTLAIIGLSVLMSIVALILLYMAKPKSSTSTRTFRPFGLSTRATTDAPQQDLYETSKINSAIGLTIAAIVFGIIAAVSSAVKKAPIAARAVDGLRSFGILPSTATNVLG